MDGVKDGVRVGVAVAVCVAVGLAVGVSEAVGVAVGNGDSVAVGVAREIDVGVIVYVGVLVAVGRGVGVAGLRALQALNRTAIVIALNLRRKLDIVTTKNTTRPCLCRKEKRMIALRIRRRLLRPAVN